VCIVVRRYSQRQRFDLPADGSGSLLLVDWATAGRMERGEAWQFQRFASRNEVRGMGNAFALFNRADYFWRPLLLAYVLGLHRFGSAAGWPSSMPCYLKTLFHWCVGHP
jgi:hypothetical protein